MILHATSRKDGTLHWERTEINRRVAFVSALEEETVLEVEIKKPRKRKSKAQRGYYWGYLIPTIAKSIHDEGGEGEQRVHEGLKAKFLIVEDPVFIWRIKSTEELDTIQTEEYYMNIRTWWAEWAGEILFLPNECPSEALF